jgi:hypothetical protein
MIIDRITLVLAYLYLDNFRSTGGEVDSILLMKDNKFRSNSKSLAKMTMEEFETYIDNIAPLTTRSYVEKNCIEQSVYSLRSFNFSISGGNRFIEYRDGEGWKVKDFNLINKMQFSQLGEYTAKLERIKKIYNELLYIDEYIILRNEYIECGEYIQVMFSPIIDEILQLYNSYKTYKIN